MLEAIAREKIGLNTAEARVPSLNLIWTRKDEQLFQRKKTNLTSMEECIDEYLKESRLRVGYAIRNAMCDGTWQ